MRQSAGNAVATQMCTIAAQPIYKGVYSQRHLRAQNHWYATYPLLSPQCNVGSQVNDVQQAGLALLRRHLLSSCTACLSSTAMLYVPSTCFKGKGYCR